MTKKIDKSFIKKMFLIALPIILEQLLSSSFGIIDTIMVKYFERGISGVGLASQFGNICGTVMFAFAVGVGMYIAQYYGDKENNNIKNSFSLLLILGFILTSIFFILGYFFPRQILSLFTKDELVLEIGVKYIKIVCFSYLPNQLSYAFVIAYRNTQNTICSFVIQLICSAINVLLNYLLIFGIWIFPKMGIEGAALATVISCIINLVIHILFALIKRKIFIPKLLNIKNALHLKFSGKILKKTFPLLINETLFSIGTLVYIAIFNKLGPDQYEGYRISEVIMNALFSISYGATAAVQAMTGECLGRSDYDEAKSYGNNFLKIGIVMSVIIGLLVAIFAPNLVNIFASDEINDITIHIATIMMYSCAVRITLKMFANILLAIFRAGGRTKFVMVLDCMVMWLIGIPIAYIGYRFLHITNIALLYLIMQIEAIVRITIGLKEYFKYKWEKNIINELLKI